MELTFDSIFKIGGFSIGLTFLIVRVINDIRTALKEDAGRLSPVLAIYHVITNLNVTLFSLISFGIFAAIYLMDIAERRGSMIAMKSDILLAIDGRSMTLDEILRELRETKNRNNDAQLLEAIRELHSDNSIMSNIKYWQEFSGQEHFTRLYYRP